MYLHRTNILLYLQSLERPRVTSTPARGARSSGIPRYICHSVVILHYYILHTSYWYYYLYYTQQIGIIIINNMIFMTYVDICHEYHIVIIVYHYILSQQKDTCVCVCVCVCVYHCLLFLIIHEGADFCFQQKNAPYIYTYIHMPICIYIKAIIRYRAYL